MNTILIGYGNYGLRDEDIFQAIPRLAAQGYEAIELCVDHRWPTAPQRLNANDRKRLIEVIQSAKMPPPVFMHLLDPFAPQATEKSTEEDLHSALKLCADTNFNSPAPSILTTTLGTSLTDWTSNREHVANLVRKMTRMAADHNVILALELHAYSEFNLPEKAEWLLEAVNHPNLRLNCDISHFLALGMDYIPILERLIPYSVYAHIKDVKADSSPPLFVSPGDGPLNLTTYFSKLNDLGYRGAVVVEVSGQIWNKPDYQPWQVAQKSFEALATARKESTLHLI